MNSKLFLLLAVASLSYAEVLNLTEDNYVAETAGRNVFVKFYAPWCGHCKAMKADWERLAEDWKDDEVGLIGEVDCTKEKELCTEFEVEGYPTLYYGDPSSPTMYSGGRDYQTLSKFANENIKQRLCSVYNTEPCADDEKLIIENLKTKSVEELSKMVTAVEDEAEEAEEAFEDEVNALQDRYNEVVNAYNAKVESIKDKSNYKYMRAVLAKMEHDIGIGRTYETDEDPEL